MQDFRDIAADIKGRVSALEAGKRMGLGPDHHGYCRCPFHQEKTGSLRLYGGQRGFYCYGCGASGSVIDLVMRYYGLNFKQAIVRLDAEFNLGLQVSARNMTLKERQEARRRAEETDARRRLREIWQECALRAFWAACDLVNVLERQIAENRPMTPETGWNEAFCQGLRLITEAREDMEHFAVLAMGGDGG